MKIGELVKHRGTGELIIVLDILNDECGVRFMKIHYIEWGTTSTCWERDLKRLTEN